MTVTEAPQKPVAVPAEYESLCQECDTTITVGELVARLAGRWVHAENCWHQI